MEAYKNFDPQLKQLSQLSLQFKSPLLDKIPVDIPGIYTLIGGRQVGKSTFLKQLILQLLENNTNPNQIFVMTGEIIIDYQDLIRTIETFLSENSGTDANWIFIDEISYITKWPLALKHLADTGQLENTFLMISGSDSTALRESMMWLPGRRGRARNRDFVYNPLSFPETILLRNSHLSDIDLLGLTPHLINKEKLDFLYSEFDCYLKTGGYLTAINELHNENMIHPQTLSIYSEWIRGDILKHGKSEMTLKELLRAIITRMGSQITWNNLLKDLSVSHPATVSDYLHLLEAMNVLIIQPALVEHKLNAAPKKARKIQITDPFIYYAIRAWIDDAKDPYQTIIETTIKDPEKASVLVEAIAVSHVARRSKAFYIKKTGEVDIAVVSNKNILPIEIKWRNQVRASDRKELNRFQGGMLVSRQSFWGKREGLSFIPLPVFLLFENPFEIPFD